MTTFVKRNWTDADAPTLAGEPGNLVRLLRQVFSEGYGSGDQATPPIPGWEMRFSEDGLKCAMRSMHPESPGYWFHIDDTDPRVAHAHGGVDFTEWDETGAWSLSAQFPTEQENPVRFVKSTRDSSEARMWTIIADERTAYLSLCRSRFGYGFVSDGDETDDRPGAARFAFNILGDIHPSPAFSHSACVLLGWGTEAPGVGNWQSPDERTGWLNTTGDKEQHGRAAAGPSGDPSAVIRPIYTGRSPSGPGRDAFCATPDNWTDTAPLGLLPIHIGFTGKGEMEANKGVVFGRLRGVLHPLAFAGDSHAAVEAIMGAPVTSNDDPVESVGILGDDFFVMPYSVQDEDLGCLFIRKAGDDS